MLLTLATTILLSSWTQAQQQSPAEKLGWQMAIHERTFQKFPLFAGMDKTAALGLKYMSLSAAVRLNGTNQVALENLSDEQIQTIKKQAEARGLTLVNAYVQLPAKEAQCRKSFEFARKMGLDTLVGEPDPAALDTVEKLCKDTTLGWPSTTTPNRRTTGTRKPCWMRSKAAGHCWGPVLTPATGYALA